MRVVVHRIDAPLVSGAVMFGVQDAVHHRVAHIEIGRSHVDLGAQHARAVGEFPGLHALEQIEILFHRTVSIPAVLPLLGQRPAILPDLIGGQIVDISLAILDQLDRPFIELVKIIGGIVETIPVETQPLDVLHDRVHIFDVFFFWIRVVETQIGVAMELVGKAEVETDGLGVTNMQIAVGLGRKARLHATLVLVCLQVLDDSVPNKI